jgi:hypothetical protein
VGSPFRPPKTAFKLATQGLANRTSILFKTSNLYEMLKSWRWASECDINRQQFLFPASFPPQIVVSPASVLNEL